MIVRLTGGIGNQLFGYLFGRALSLRRNEPVQFHWAKATREYALDLYNVDVELVQPTGNEPIYDEPGFAFDANALNQPPNTYYRGYWQSPKYWQKYWPELRKHLTLKDPVRIEIEAIAKRLAYDPSSVFLHVRRNDYVTNPGVSAFHGNLGMDYYERAIQAVRQRLSNPHFMVFSDDPVWCAQNFKFPVISTENYQRHEDLYLMQHCWHGIGANSSFSWFANWLGNHPNRIAVMPEKWFTDASINTLDLMPATWIRV